jgi:cysteine desulfurase family protein (TIGR01976 family)
MIGVDTTETALDVAAVRRMFPALEREHAGYPVAYFDAPGGTQVPRRVVDAMEEYLYRHNANTHWSYPTSAETDEALERARAALADLLGCGADEVVLGANMTTLTFHLARALGRTLAAGDEVVVTELDHHANIDPWLDLARERGLVARVVRLEPETGTLDWGDFEAKLSERTRLVAIGLASNALGTVNDVPRAIAAARSVGARVFVDAVHAVPSRPIDFAALGCELLACSAYKFYGPHVGIVAVRRDLIDELPAPRLLPAAEQGAERLETGTLDHEGIVGAAAAVELLASLGEGTTRRERVVSGLGAVHRRGEELVTRLWHGLAEIPGVRLHGPPPGAPRTATVAFTVGDVASRAVAVALAESEAVFVSHGDFYAQTVVERLGLAHQGLVRAGCACTTTEEEVDRLLAGVRRIAGEAMSSCSAR